jgi:putative hydrolase
MSEQISLLQDCHVHSRFSDGEGTLAENIAAAEALGLEALTCVDHVRVSTDWVPAYVEAVHAARGSTDVKLSCGIEAKLLDTDGTLDLPPEFDGIDAIYAADHQVPLADGPHHPRQIRAEIESGERTAASVIEAIVASTAAAVRRYPQVVIAHLFSVLPKIGVSEDDVDPELVAALAVACAETDACIEISERWRCPTARTLRPFLEHGVTVLVSTDSHRSETIGRYEYCADVVTELDAFVRPL